MTRSKSPASTTPLTASVPRPPRWTVVHRIDHGAHPVDALEVEPRAEVLHRRRGVPHLAERAQGLERRIGGREGLAVPGHGARLDSLQALDDEEVRQQAREAVGVALAVRASRATFEMRSTPEGSAGIRSLKGSRLPRLDVDARHLAPARRRASRRRADAAVRRKAERKLAVLDSGDDARLLRRRSGRASPCGPRRSRPRTCRPASRRSPEAPRRCPPARSRAACRASML